ncbi:Methyltransferase-like protein 21B [Balamuthia mandrillaris]
MDCLVLLQALKKLPEREDGEAPQLQVSVGFAACGTVINIHQDYCSDVWGQVWKAGVAMMNYVQHLGADGFWKGKKVLDLGSGTGLLGIALSLLGAHVMVTDVASALDQLRLNVRANTDPSKHKIVVRELDWYVEVPQDLKRTRWDFVLATDVIYNPIHFEALMATLEQVCNPTNTLLLGYEKRPHTARFFELLYSAFQEKIKVPYEQFCKPEEQNDMRRVALFHFQKLPVDLVVPNYRQTQEIYDLTNSSSDPSHIPLYWSITREADWSST